MCRILALVPPTRAPGLGVLRGLRRQAVDSRAGTPQGERHPHGWSVVEAHAGRLRYLARSAKDAGTDPEYDALMSRMEGGMPDAFLLAHVRQASRGTISVPNTHPFMHDGWAFCHNGTIHGIGDEPGQTYEGDTDSERYFRRLLRHLRMAGSVEAAMRACAGEIDAAFSYTSLTCLFTDGRSLYGYRRVGSSKDDFADRERALEHYGLGVGRVGDQVIVAQEATHLGSVRDWQAVPDGGFLKIEPGRPPLIHPLNSRPMNGMREASSNPMLRKALASTEAHK